MPVLYRKWRPQTLTEVVGQEPTTRTLLHALETGRVAHAYLFCGPRGTGKTSTTTQGSSALARLDIPSCIRPQPGLEVEVMALTPVAAAP